MPKTDDRKKTEDVIIYEEDFYADKEAAVESLQILVFRLSQEWYGINVAKIKMAMKVQQIVYLPFAPASIAGITNFRGDIMSVTDLKKIFGLPDSELTETTRLIIIESGLCSSALLVDQIDEIIAVPVSEIYPKLETIAPQRAQYIEAGCRFGQRLLGILDVERIFQKDH